MCTLKWSTTHKHYRTQYSAYNLFIFTYNSYYSELWISVDFSTFKAASFLPRLSRAPQPFVNMPRQRKKARLDKSPPANQTRIPSFYSDYGHSSSPPSIRSSSTRVSQPDYTPARSRLTSHTPTLRDLVRDQDEALTQIRPHTWRYQVRSVVSLTTLLSNSFSLSGIDTYDIESYQHYPHRNYLSLST
jgi:hypothetical protein